MRIANPNPVYCSSCFQQKPHDTHIDFEVAWDGPVISEDGLRMTIDDLIVCEDCLAGASAQLGFVKANKDVAGELRKVSEKAAKERAGRLTAERRARELERKLTGLEGAMGVLLHAREALESVHLELQS